MIVDDRQENLFSLRSLLLDMDVEVLCAETGARALSLLMDHEFAVAILDVQMPEMNGFELAQLMRGAERTKNIPIIFVTAGVSTEVSEFKGYESGAVDYLPKPLNSAILKAKVRVFLDLAKQKERLSQKILELERVSKEAAAAKETAEQANRLKSSFLANMSHEIRTPLGALMGFAELLKEDISIEERIKYVDVILRNGKALVQIIDEILDLSKIEAGHVEMDLGVTPVRKVISDICDLLRPMAEKKNLQFKVAVGSDVPETIGTDELRFRQIVTNLLGNAIKFTTKGSVSMEVHHDARARKIGVLVKDTGIGIPMETAKILFKPFSQGDASITRSFGGTGLGLSLSKRLAQLLGGDVILKSSRPKEGSVFEITIMNHAMEVIETEAGSRASRSGSTLAEAFDGLSVLVVDDSVDNQFFVRMLLESKGVDVGVASHGQEGYTKALEGHFDIILMDLQMPVCDGIKATQMLRDQSFKKPIIALTANAMKEERDRCLKMGFDDYVSKPIDKKILFEALMRWSQDEARPSSSQGVSLH